MSEWGSMSEPLESAGEKKVAFTVQIEKLLEQTQGNLNSISNELLEINRTLLPPRPVNKMDIAENKQGPQGWFQKVIAKLENLQSKSNDIKMELQLLLYEVTNKK